MTRNTHSRSTATTHPGSDATANPASDDFHLESVVRDGETVAAKCPHCERPFRSERAHDLHVGSVHPDACSDPERAAHDDAAAAEDDDLFYFHLKIVAALGALYGLVVVVYMLALGSGII